MHFYLSMEVRRAHLVRARRIRREQNVSTILILALVCLNAAFVFLRQDDEVGEDSPLIRYSTSSGRNAIAAFNISVSGCVWCLFCEDIHSGKKSILVHVKNM